MTQLAVERVIADLAVHHKNQTKLCEELEAIADAMPASVDNQRCLTIARQIFPIVQQAHKFEEQVLFPILSALPDQHTNLERSLERLRFEHWEDESLAEDLSETLREFGKSELDTDIDKLSYMLRGFFDGIRRHMAFEVEHLLPLLDGEVSRAFR